MQYILISAISKLINVIEILIIIDVILSFMAPLRSNEFIRLIRSIVNPILDPCYRIQKSIIPNLPIDFSPAIAIFLLDILKKLIINILLTIY
ncbi:YggT family protein [Caloramator sp. E03]|uniref:YggT family protein n=1 Tax=Caloramator sp. E03 TaxID=2576307 RepID=UPI00143D0B5C|nr:YggT family protein [Caloramator sp. E03]